MKKIIAILLTALLVCGCTAALAQDALTVDELTNFWRWARRLWSPRKPRMACTPMSLIRSP